MHLGERVRRQNGHRIRRADKRLERRDATMKRVRVEEIRMREEIEETLHDFSWLIEHTDCLMP